VIQIVDTEENIQRLLPSVEEMMDKGLIAMSDVSILRIQKAAAQST
jgi:PII-like signaling protein